MSKFVSSNIPPVDRRGEGRATTKGVAEMGRRGLLLSTVVAASQVNDSKTELLKNITPIHYSIRATSDRKQFRKRKRKRTMATRTFVKREPTEDVPDIDDAVEVSRSIRDIQPAHYLVKIDSFSVLCESDMEKYESDDFEAGGYKWRLCLYPNGNEKRNGNNHISLFLVISDTESLPQGWEVNVQFKLFVYDHIRDKYLTIQDAHGKIRRFHGMKTEWGFAQLLSLETFNNTSNGYLFDDSCVFGAEVFVIKYAGNGQCLSMIKKTANNNNTWKIEKISAIEEVNLTSNEFKVGELNWKLLVYPKGNIKRKGESLSLFLSVADSATLPLTWRSYAEYKLRIRNQVFSNHVEREGRSWFCASSPVWGYDNFMLLNDLNDKSKGFAVNDTLIVEAEITIMAMIRNFS